MPFDPVIADTRFGTGLSPLLPPPDDTDAMLARLAGPDHAARDWPMPGFLTATPTPAAMADVTRRRRLARGTPQAASTEAEYRALTEAARDARQDHLKLALIRDITTQDGLRERLVAFWADHFALRARLGTTTHLVAAFAEDAIRPHVAGRFADMLRAAVTHPMMVLYLDQSRSTGPTSAQAQGGRRGLNENLAREVLELHTLGVDGPYTQTDVRELAEAMTGLAWDPALGTTYRPEAAEPGAETLLGQTLSPEAGLATVHEALDTLAAHPQTALHLARKLAVHVVADDPDPDLVATLAARWLATDGDLAQVTAALLDHPAAWAPARAKVRRPWDYLAAALRALAVPPAALLALERGPLRHLVLRPLEVMGQPWQSPPGPDGWAEAAADWITPQFLAGRIDWAMTAPARLLPDLPDPRAFAVTALGTVPDAVAFAAAAAETRAAGIGLILSSPEFQRR